MSLQVYISFLQDAHFQEQARLLMSQTKGADRWLELHTCCSAAVSSASDWTGGGATGSASADGAHKCSCCFRYSTQVNKTTSPACCAAFMKQGELCLLYQYKTEEVIAEGGRVAIVMT